MKPSKEIDYKGFFDRIHDLIYQTNNDGIITLANPAFAKIFSYESEQEIIGKNTKEFYVNPNDRDKLKDKLRSRGGYITDYIVHVKKKTGERFYLAEDCRIMTNEKGEEIGVEGIGRDVTKREAELKRIIEERDRFFIDIAHELRTPMATIFVAAENIQKGITPINEIPKTLGKIVTELQRLNLLAERFWRSELIYRGMLEYRPSNVNVYEIFSVCRTLMASLAMRKNINIEIDDEIKKWRPLRVDAEMFKHAVLNLLDNAIRYSYPNTIVKIYGRFIRGYKELIVQNRGIEIADDEKERIFQRYYRTQKAISVSPSGSGIGLMIIKDFADKHGAKIEVNSVPIGGESGAYLNSFSIIFP